MRRSVLSSVLAGVSLAASAVAAEALPPLLSIRLRGPHTGSDEQWAKTARALIDNRAACDEVWFSTGIGVPDISWHREHVKRLARYAEELRAAGIVPSLQFQATLGHGDEITSLEGTDGKKWGGFTGRGGTECRYCNCPRQPAFLDYLREMSRLYASFRPGSVWIDDDLRVAGHAPGSPWTEKTLDWIGCWCPTCIDAFNRETGGKWTRETLDAAAKKDKKLFARWEKFSFDGIAAIARLIAGEIHRISPTTRFGYQHGGYFNDSQLAVFRALNEASGLPVGSRPGGGAYFDLDPHEQNVKAFEAVRQRQNLGDPSFIDTWCVESETCPRAFGSRTAQGLLNESIVNLAYGLNSVSFLIMDTRAETDAWYGENLLAPLAAEKELLAGYRRANAGARPAGVGMDKDVPLDRAYALALAGVPVCYGPGVTPVMAKSADIGGLSIANLSSKAMLELRRKWDAKGGKLPVLAETPSVGLVVPQVRADGTLATVFLMNCRIDVQKPVTLRLRGVPTSARKAIWRAFRSSPVELPLVREGTEATVTVPALAAWSAGYLAP